MRATIAPTRATSTTRARPDRTRRQTDPPTGVGRLAVATVRSGTVMDRTAAGWADIDTPVAGSGSRLRIGALIVAG